MDPKHYKALQDNLRASRAEFRTAQDHIADLRSQIERMEALQLVRRAKITGMELALQPDSQTLGDK